MQINQVSIVSNNLKLNTSTNHQYKLTNNLNNISQIPNLNTNKYKSHQPSFGTDPITIGFVLWDLAKFLGIIFGLTGAAVVAFGGVYYAVMKISEWVDERRKKAQEKFKLQIIKDQNAIYEANNKQISEKKVKEIYNADLEKIAIPPTGTGEEVGLNNIIGCDLLKLGLARNVLLPLLQTLDGNPTAKNRIPNGINFFGPKGTGKTFIAQNLGEHYEEKGGHFEEIEFSGNDEKDIEMLKGIFSEAEKRFKASDKKEYTMILLDEIEKSAQRADLPDAHNARTNALLKLTNNCKDKGVVLLTTSNDLTLVSPDLMRTGRTDLRVPVGSVDIHDAADMINFYVKKSGVISSQLNYREITDALKTKNLAYKPKEIEAAIQMATMNISTGYLDTKKILEVFDDNDIELNEDDIKLFEEEKEMVKKLGGINPNARYIKEDTVNEEANGDR